jgi:hypothetical protein
MNFIPDKEKILLSFCKKKGRLSLVAKKTGFLRKAQKSVLSGSLSLQRKRSGIRGGAPFTSLLQRKRTIF